MFAYIFTDIMSRSSTVVVIPEVVPEDGQQRVVVLPQDHAVLPVVVVGLALSPVEPAHRLVLVRPPPLAGTVLAVTILKIHLLDAFNLAQFGTDLRHSSKPKLAIFPNVRLAQ